jgi:hypothetical protein
MQVRLQVANSVQRFGEAVRASVDNSHAQMFAIISHRTGINAALASISQTCGRKTGACSGTCSNCYKNTVREEGACTRAIESILQAEEGEEGGRLLMWRQVV